MSPHAPSPPVPFWSVNIGVWPNMGGFSKDASEGIESNHWVGSEHSRLQHEFKGNTDHSLSSL